jgi:hypothetical protein
VGTHLIYTAFLEEPNSDETVDEFDWLAAKDDRTRMQMRLARQDPEEFARLEAERPPAQLSGVRDFVTQCAGRELTLEELLVLAHALEQIGDIPTCDPKKRVRKPKDVYSWIGGYWVLTRPPIPRALEMIFSH